MVTFLFRHNFLDCNSDYNWPFTNSLSLSHFLNVEREHLAFEEKNNLFAFLKLLGLQKVSFEQPFLRFLPVAHRVFFRDLEVLEPSSTHSFPRTHEQLSRQHLEHVVGVPQLLHEIDDIGKIGYVELLFPSIRARFAPSLRRFCVSQRVPELLSSRLYV